METLILTSAVSYIDCGAPDVPNNGRIDTDNFWFDSVVRYTCEKGWDLEGERERMCLANGTWSGSAPTCRREWEGDIINLLLLAKIIPHILKLK